VTRSAEVGIDDIGTGYADLADMADALVVVARDEEEQRPSILFDVPCLVAKPSLKYAGVTRPRRTR
jgi:hypothetical protein